MQDIKNNDFRDKIQHLKQAVNQMLSELYEDASQGETKLPTPLWSECLGVFAYIINLSEDDFLNIRFHTPLITGESHLLYWHPYPAIEPEKFAENIGYKFYTEDLPQNYWAGEPPTPKIPRLLGVNYRGKIINYNICRYQSCISNLYSMGVLLFLEQQERSLVLEIGGGYGGIAHALGNVLRKSTYIILDLPEMLLFSGGYLIVNNPASRIYMYTKDTFTHQFLSKDIYSYDYVLLPNYVLKDLYNIANIDLMINMQSFQEMSKEQINEYLQFVSSRLSGYIYSDNMDVHPYNNTLFPATVTKLLSGYFNLFPTLDFYEDKIDIKSQNYCSYKRFVGTSKNKKIIKFPNGSMRWSYSGREYLLLNHNGEVSFKVIENRKSENEINVNNLSRVKPYLRKIPYLKSVINFLRKIIR